MWYFVFMTSFRFDNEHSATQVANIVDVLRQPRLWIPTEKDYPNHGEWLDKTEALIASGKKRAMAAYMGNQAIGAVIYQQSVESPSVVEIRNISVSPDGRGRHIGSFLLRNVEIEAARNDFSEINEFVVDTKLTNTGMIAFLKSEGYSIKETTDLYGLNAGLDAVLSKSAKR
jgi:ribosomal protein S18 acetylase RimI-like enzyme